MRIRLLGVVLLTFLNSVFFTLSSVSAQDNSQQSALAVSPAIFELVLEPGVKKETKVTVFNVTNFPLPIKAFVKSFLPAKGELDNENKEIFDASSWFGIEEPDFILQPKQQREVTVTLNPPEKAEPGGHYATIYFQPLIPAEAVSANTAYLTARVGVLAFLIVKGDIQEKASLLPLQTENLRQFGPVNIALPFKNEGNVHLLPSGNLIIFDWQGKEVVKLDLKPEIVLPKEKKDFIFKWDEQIIFGKFSAQAKVDFGSEYEKLESKTIEFWVVPWLPFSVGLVLFCLMVFLLIFARKRLHRAWRILIRGVEEEISSRRG